MLKSRAQLYKDRRVRVLRNDFGGEYQSIELIAFLETDGTQQKLTTAHSPHQSGVAERLNCELKDFVRAMVAGKRVTNGSGQKLLQSQCMYAVESRREHFSLTLSHFICGSVEIQTFHIDDCLTVIAGTL